MKVSKEGFDLIKRFEGWRDTAYRDSVGVLTIGYGHTSAAGLPVVSAGMKISKEEGQAILERDVNTFSEGVKKLITVNLSDNQFSAIVSFAYNVGLGNLKKSSVLKYINSSLYDLVPVSLSLWNKAGGNVLPGLTRRRAAEGELFRRV
jgi:lysozyme